MAGTEQFSLRWNNFHSNLTSGFHDLLEAADMVDVTLAIDGHFLQAHKLVLSICSPYFKQLFKINPCNHPIVILKDVSHGNMKDILEFMYMGEVNVLRENLPSFLRTAELLQVKGLTGDDSSDTSSKKDDDTYCDNDDESDYNQLTESESSMLSQYTSKVPSPHHHHQQQQQQQPQQQPEQQPQQQPQQQSQQQPQQQQQQKSPVGNNFKRSTKNTLTNNNSKRVKSETTSTPITKTNAKSIDTSEIIPANEDDSEFFEVSTKAYQAYEKDDSLVKQENYSFDSYTSTGDANSQDHDSLCTGNKEGKIYVYCPYCFRKFVNRYNLKIHIRDKHDTSEANLDCVVCGKRMRNKSCLRVHMYHHRKQQLQLLEQNSV